MMYLLDKSAYVTAKQDERAMRELETLAAREPIAMCAMAALEILYSARTLARHRESRIELTRNYVWLDTTESILKEALMLQEVLHAKDQHRKPPPDIMIAAVAKHYRATVLHYDSDFDDISRVEPGVRSHWIIPRQRGGGDHAAEARNKHQTP